MSIRVGTINFPVPSTDRSLILDGDALSVEIVPVCRSLQKNWLIACIGESRAGVVKAGTQIVLDVTGAHFECDLIKKEFEVESFMALNPEYTGFSINQISDFPKGMDPQRPASNTVWEDFGIPRQFGIKDLPRLIRSYIALRRNKQEERSLSAFLGLPFYNNLLFMRGLNPDPDIIFSEQLLKDHQEHLRTNILQAFSVPILLEDGDKRIEWFHRNDVFRLVDYPEILNQLLKEAGIDFDLEAFNRNTAQYKQAIGNAGRTFSMRSNAWMPTIRLAEPKKIKKKISS